MNLGRHQTFWKRLFGIDPDDANFRLVTDEEIGRGGLCLVHRRRFANGWEEVEKRLLPKFQGKAEYESLQVSEFEILKDLDHPLIVRALRLESRTLVLKEPTTILVLESLEAQPLSNLISFVQSLDDRRRKIWCRQLLGQMVTALNYLRSMSIIHGDLSPDNILVRSNGLIKVIDFATATSPTNPAQRFQIRGKAAFRAPEIRDLGSASMSADIFAVGKIYESLLGPILSAHSEASNDLIEMLEKRNLPEILSYEPLNLLPKTTPSYRAPTKERTKIIFPFWDPRAWGRSVGFCAILFVFAGLTTSWMPQFGYLSVNALPLQISHSVDRLGSHLWRDKPLRNALVPAGKLVVSFRGPGLGGRVITKTLIVQPAEYVKVFEDFRKVDTLSK